MCSGKGQEGAIVLKKLFPHFLCVEIPMSGPSKFSLVYEIWNLAFYIFTLLTEWEGNNRKYQREGSNKSQTAGEVCLIKDFFAQVESAEIQREKNFVDKITDFLKYLLIIDFLIKNRIPFLSLNLHKIKIHWPEIRNDKSL